VRRRRALQWLAGAAVPLRGGNAIAAAGRCAAIPDETAGPFPADGSNGRGGVANVLTLAGVVRNDIRASIGGMSGRAEGVPLSVVLNLVDANAGCTALAGHAVYLWHCDREGRYSLYSSGVTDQNYLRGVQVSDAAGQVRFTTVFPGCYAGRMPHLHVEVYRSLAAATSPHNRLKTSQIAFARDVCDAVYGAAGYAASADNFARISFASDGVFRDGTALQMASVAGSAAAGYVATLNVGLGG
jgi:protocatechuate 3,4-dioxygenase beta subunit